MNAAIRGPMRGAMLRCDEAGVPKVVQHIERSINRQFFVFTLFDGGSVKVRRRAMPTMRGLSGSDQMIDARFHDAEIYVLNLLKEGAITHDDIYS